MMDIRKLTILILSTALLSSCVPMPSYSVEPYAGSLNQCLDIQGTYERGGSLDFYLLPLGLKKTFIPNKDQRGGDKRKSVGKRENDFFNKKSWVTIRFLDAQNLEAQLFNIEGEAVSFIFNMQEGSTNFPYQEEKISCNKVSWQHAYAATHSTDGHRKKWRFYSETKKQQDQALKMVVKNDTGGGAFGLYVSDDGVDRTNYFRKVDLTVEDIREMNDKAKKAITQYDEVAMSPPSTN